MARPTATTRVLVTAVSGTAIVYAILIWDIVVHDDLSGLAKFAFDLGPVIVGGATALAALGRARPMLVGVGGFGAAAAPVFLLGIYFWPGWLGVMFLFLYETAAMYVGAVPCVLYRWYKRGVEQATSASGTSQGSP